MKEYTTKQLKRDTLVKLMDGTMAVIRDNEPSVKRKVEMIVDGKPQLSVIESYQIVSFSTKGKGWHDISHTDKERERQAAQS